MDRETRPASDRKTKAAVTAENYSIIGGAYSAVSETLAREYPIPARRTRPLREVGQMDYLRQALHL